ncbi:hypothetical protein T07_12562 [Trichinella nelsoni]|uniref:Uncharacterized protein n=1 Tax=Trichinella nelsoni TaxID=6336 RepID=A0A0V0S9J6_9BILA|nr:hypothetical protein T07_12562 [Trichinella nelsoni]
MPWTLADQNTIMVIKLIKQPIDGRTDRLPTEPTHQIFQQSRNFETIISTHSAKLQQLAGQ